MKFFKTNSPQSHITCCGDHSQRPSELAVTNEGITSDLIDHYKAVMMEEYACFIRSFNLRPKSTGELRTDAWARHMRGEISQEEARKLTLTSERNHVRAPSAKKTFFKYRLVGAHREFDANFLQIDNARN